MEASNSYVAEMSRLSECELLRDGAFLTFLSDPNDALALTCATRRWVEMLFTGRDDAEALMPLVRGFGVLLILSRWITAVRALVDADCAFDDDGKWCEVYERLYDTIDHFRRRLPSVWPDDLGGLLRDLSTVLARAPLMLPLLPHGFDCSGSSSGSLPAGDSDYLERLLAEPF